MRKDRSQVSRVGGDWEGGESDPEEDGDELVEDNACEEVGLDGGEVADEEVEEEERRSRRSQFRQKALFWKILPVSLANQMEVFRKLLEDFDDDKIKFDKNTIIDGTADRSTIYRYRTKLGNFLVKSQADFGLDPAKLLLQWAQKLVCGDEEAFYRSGFGFVSQWDVPKEIRVKKISESLTAYLIRERRNPDCRMVSLKHAVQVAKQAGLHISQRGDIVALVQGDWWCTL